METESALRRLSQQLSSLKLGIEEYAKSIKKTTKDIVEEYKKSAAVNIRLELILIEIQKKENLKSRKEVLDKITAL